MWPHIWGVFGGCMATTDNPSPRSAPIFHHPLMSDDHVWSVTYCWWSCVEWNRKGDSRVRRDATAASRQLSGLTSCTYHRLAVCWTEYDAYCLGRRVGTWRRGWYCWRCVVGRSQRLSVKSRSDRWSGNVRSTDDRLMSVVASGCSTYHLCKLDERCSGLTRRTVSCLCRRATHQWHQWYVTNDNYEVGWYTTDRCYI